MLQWDYLLKIFVQKALMDISLPEGESFFFNNEIKIISPIVKALIPIKTTVEVLCCQNANLFTGDIAITFILKILKDTNHFVNQILHPTLILQMQQRQQILVGSFSICIKGELKIMTWPPQSPDLPQLSYYGINWIMRYKKSL